MNIVLGVDGINGPDEPSAVVSLLRRLRFPNAAVDVVDVIEPIVYGDWGIDVVLTAQAFAIAEEDRRRNARKAVQQVAAHLRAGNPAVPEEYDRAIVRTDCPQAGSTTEGIIAAADHHQADLIAVEGPHHGPLGAFLTGSVARSLVIGAQHHSLLLAKAPQLDEKGVNAKSPTPKDDCAVCPQDQFAEPISQGRWTDAPLRVVFATDHSPYAKRCLRKLAAMAPQGISHLTVLCAYPEADLDGIAKCLPDLAIDLDAPSVSRSNDATTRPWIFLHRF